MLLTFGGLSVVVQNDGTETVAISNAEATLATKLRAPTLPYDLGKRGTVLKMTKSFLVSLG